MAKPDKVSKSSLSAIAPRENPDKGKGKNLAITSQPYKNGLAMLDNLIDGKALPSHLARSAAGLILPRAKSAAETLAEESARFNDAIAKEVAAKMALQPLMAICHSHKCRCGNAWQTFGFYARKVIQRIPGEADASFTKRLDYDPSPELPQSVEWQEVEETHCLACFDKGASRA